MSFKQQDTAFLNTFYKTAAINQKRHPYLGVFFYCCFY